MWKFEGLLTKNLDTPTTTDNSLSPIIRWHEDSDLCLVFRGSRLKQRNITFTLPNKTNIFIIYELDAWSWDLNSYFTLKDCLFGGAHLAENADPDKYIYSGYGIGFDSRSEYLLLDASVDKNVIIFGVVMSSSLHINNKGKVILILDKVPTQGLDDTALKVKARYSIDFSRSNKIFLFKPVLA